MAVNLAGTEVTQEVQAYADNIQRDDSFGDLFNKSLHTGNAAMVMWDTVSRAWSHEYDPSFDVSSHYEELTKGIPAEYHGKFETAKSLLHAQEIRSGIQQDLQDMQELGQNGIKGMAAMLTAGIIDVDWVLGYGKAASMGRKATAAARILHGAAMGAAAGAVTESVIAAEGDIGQWSDVPAAMLMGAVLGGVGGGLAKDMSPGLSFRSVEPDAEFNPLYRTGTGEFADAAVAPRVSDPGTVPGLMAATPASSMQVARDFQKYQTDPNATKAMSQLADPIEDYTGARVFQAEEGSTMAQRAEDTLSSLKIDDPAKRTGWLGAYTKLLQTSPLSDLTTRLWNSGSSTAKALTVSLFESAEGFFINNRSGAMVMDAIQQRGYKQFTQGYSEVLQKGYKENGIGMFDLKKQQAYNMQLSEDVVKAANDLRLGRNLDGYSEQVKVALAKVDEFSEYIRQEARGGASGARIVPGFERVEHGAPHVPLIWSGEKMRRLLSSVDRKEIEKAVREAYMNANPEMQKADAGILARALIRRAETKGSTVDTNLNSLLAGDGKEFLKQALVDNGISEDAALGVLNRLSAKDSDTGKVGFARHRTDIDLSGTYNGIRIIDMVDTDLDRVMFGYSDVMGKRIALSRHGIDNMSQIEHIKNTVLDEAMKSGKDTAALKTLRQDLDYAFQNFQPGSLDSAMNPWVRRAKQATNLSLLSKLALPQLAETGAIMALAGVRNFLAASPIFKKVVQGMNTKEVTNDLGWMVGNLGYERGILRSDLVADLALDGVKGNNTFVRHLDSALATGQNVQGAISGYTKVMEAQINTAALSFTNKLFRVLRDGTEGKHKAFFQSAGITDTRMNDLRKLVTDGTVKFNRHGHVDRLQPEKWDSILRESYGFSTIRAVRQMVQRPLAGETQPWLHDATLGIFGHLQTFPLLSMRKQFMRNALRGDGTLPMLTLYGLGTASVAGAIRNFTEGKEQTAESISKAALTYSNSIGWTTLGIDPIARLVGLQDYAPGGRYAGEFQLPMLSTASRALGIPEALASAITPGASFTKEDKKALQVIPVVGGYYGMSRLLDGLVTTDD